MSAPRRVVGVDIGNSTTEACLAEVNGEEVRYLSSWLTKTTGVKGTLANLAGAKEAVKGALNKAGVDKRLDLVLINEATPVLSGMAMETITETVITESTMVGHNPTTPGGEGLGVGMTTSWPDLGAVEPDAKVIVIIPKAVSFTEAAKGLSAAIERGVKVVGCIVQRDDARLIANRIPISIPIVDEVRDIERVPVGMLAAVEVALPGHTIQQLSNPYGLASHLDLDAEQTKMISPVARALVGLRSAVVVRTPKGEIRDRKIPAGKLFLVGTERTHEVGVDEGAEEIMRAVRRMQPLEDVRGESGTNAGGMLSRVKSTMADLHGMELSEVTIDDLLAVETFVPQEVRGALSGEISLESAVALAAMVRTTHGPMKRLAELLEGELGCEVRVGGVEAEMALRGALTTPGTAAPIALLDLGGGSTDAAYLDGEAQLRTTHVAGAGDLVTRLIASELGLEDMEVAEHLKRHPIAKVESPFHIRLEDGTVTFMEEPVPAEMFARVVTLVDGAPYSVVPVKQSLEKIVAIRRDAKRKIFVTNALRSLEAVAPGNNPRRLGFVVLLGGSSLDFEIPEMISQATAELGLVCGAGNVRSVEGPRNAVATGLVVAHAEVSA